MELNIKLKNCFWIKNIDHAFQFLADKAIVLYAPNGTMKTSLSKTFKYIQENNQKSIKDNIFNCESEVLVQFNNDNIKPQEIFVIPTFENFFKSSKMADLLIDNGLKNDLEELFKKRNEVLKELEKYSWIKWWELEDVLVRIFWWESFLSCIPWIDLDISCDFSNIVYSVIFDNSIIKKIQTPDFQNSITMYLNKSEEIYKNFAFLESGKFSLPKLKLIAKSLKDNQFYSRLWNKIILEKQEGEFGLNELEEKILEIEQNLKETKEFEKIEKLLSDSKWIKLKDILDSNPDIISYLKKETLWILEKELFLSYLNQIDWFQELKNNYSSFLKALSSIDFDNSKWNEAYKIFQERFSVPFTMRIVNKESVILWESLPRIEFIFSDWTQTVSKDREFIETDVLSQWEKRALYLLNIIFEIEWLKNDTSIEKVLFVIDDIADSFDYKNKYAIIEYLRDISKEDKFYELILTHNFDFFRIIQNRITKNAYISEKTEQNINIIKCDGKILNPFSAWKKNVTSNSIFIALIPFVRNLFEYMEWNNSEEYILLTYILHKKLEEYNNDDMIIPKTEDITLWDIKKILLKKFPWIVFENISHDNEKMLNIIFFEANELLNSCLVDWFNLENKLLLAIAIRLKAEEFMWNNVRSKAAIKWNQMIKLFDRYKNDYPWEKEKIRILDRVNVLTPENIHVNSFMYEPILDMSIDSLKKLYSSVSNL